MNIRNFLSFVAVAILMAACGGSDGPSPATTGVGNGDLGTTDVVNSPSVLSVTDPQGNTQITFSNERIDENAARAIINNGNTVWYPASQLVNQGDEEFRLVQVDPNSGQQVSQFGNGQTGFGQQQTSNGFSVNGQPVNGIQQPFFNNQQAGPGIFTQSTRQNRRSGGSGRLSRNQARQAIELCDRNNSVYPCELPNGIIINLRNDGTFVMRYPNGDREIYLEDGTLIEKYNDAFDTEVVTNPDGSQVVTRRVPMFFQVNYVPVAPGIIPTAPYQLFNGFQNSQAASFCQSAIPIGNACYQPVTTAVGSQQAWTFRFNFTTQVGGTTYDCRVFN